MRVRRHFQQYEIEAEIGRGGMSRVFRAKDPSLDRRVALKVLLDGYSDEEERLLQFQKEAHITASITHPNVVKIYAVGREHRDLFIVMELVENGSLDEFIAAGGKVTESQGLTWALQTAQGLQAAYQNGLIHRDVKPGNILLSKDRSTKLVDFGLALMFRREVDRSEDIWATPCYVPPEKLSGEGEDHRSDIYSLGATLYHLLAGEPSFEVKSGSYKELRDAKAKPVSLNDAAPHLSSETCALVGRMMAPDPDDRPATYDGLIAQIEEANAPWTILRSKSPSSGRNAADRFLAHRRARRDLNRTRAGRRCLAVVGVAAVLGLVWFTIQRDPKPKEKPWAESPEKEVPIGLEDAEGPALDDLANTALASAQKAFRAGDWERARQGFGNVYQANETPPGIKQWALFHQGLAELLAGREPASRQTFSTLKNEPGSEERLTGFFRDAGNILRGDAPVPAGVAEASAEGFCYPVALLAYGLKNWERGAYPEARAHLQRFATLTPGPGFKWIETYRSLVEDRLADLTWLPNLTDIEPITTKSALEREIETLASFTERAKTKRARSLLAEGLASARLRLAAWDQAPKPAKDEAAMRKKLEVQTWLDLQAEMAPLGKTMHFGKGRDLLKAKEAVFQIARGRRSFEDQLCVWATAKSFIDHSLVAIPGQRVNLSLVDGKKLSGEITVASRDAVSVHQSSGDITVPLDKLAPLGLARSALRLTEEIRDSNLFYQRKEELVVFACLTGLEDIFKNHGDDLRRENRPFRERWARIQAFSRPLTNHSHHG